MLTSINFFYRHVQKNHTLLANFGFISQARYMIESIGPELRQYLYAKDTEEMPFPRVIRTEIYKKAKNQDSSTPFGSKKLFDGSEYKLRHSMYPADQDQIKPFKVTFGEERGIKTAYTITKPIIISAMSYGALGSQAILALSRGAKKAGIPMNTGEGGFPKYHIMEGSDLIFQMGTAKFGVRNSDGSLNDELLQKVAGLESVKMIEVKFSQGAKPGKGGLLPKEKITKEISELRGVPMDEDVISPAHHLECVDAKTTVQFIKRVQDVSQLPVGIKFCVGREDEIYDLFKQMKADNAFPDYIDIDGSEGGTGAAPKSFMDDIGLGLFDALPKVHKMLIDLEIRSKLKILAAGKLVNPGRQMIAMSIGADAVYSARGFMMAIGCIQAIQCNRNTCPVGITTHDPHLQKGLDIESKSERVKNYVLNLEHEHYELLASTGRCSFPELDEKNVIFPINKERVYT